MQAMYLDDSELPTRSRYAEVKRKFQFHDGQIFDQWRDSTCVRLDKALSLHVHVYFQSQNERKHPEKKHPPLKTLNVITRVSSCEM